MHSNSKWMNSIMNYDAYAFAQNQQCVQSHSFSVAGQVRALDSSKILNWFYTALVYVLTYVRCNHIWTQNIAHHNYLLLPPSRPSSSSNKPTFHFQSLIHSFCRSPTYILLLIYCMHVARLHWDTLAYSIFSTLFVDVLAFDFVLF